MIELVGVGECKVWGYGFEIEGYKNILSVP